MGEDIEPGKYRCPVCPNKGFHTIGDKKRHVRTEHPKQEEKS